jgi:hypothetical protein
MRNVKMAVSNKSGEYSFKEARKLASHLNKKGGKKITIKPLTKKQELASSFMKGYEAGRRR